MKHFLGKINKIFMVGFLAFSLIGGFLYNVHLMNQKADAAFYAVQSPATTLYTGISSGATSARLRSFVDIGGTKLTMAMFGSIGYVTFEPGVTGKEEVVSFTGITDNGDGSQTITGLSRGLYSRYPFGTGGTARSHGSNTYVVVSNSGEFYNQLAIKSNAETITGVWTFNSWALPKVNSSTTDAMLVASGTSTLATLEYVNNTATSGAPNATVAVKGLVEMATLAEASSTTALAGGGTGASLAIGTDLVGATPFASGIVMAQSSGKILQGWLDLAASWAFTGGFSSSATSTFTGTTTAVASKAVFGFGDMAQVMASTTLTGNTTPQPVYISTTTDAVNLSDANVTADSQFVGFAIANGTNGATTTVQFSGVVQGFSGLARGAKYYVQDAVGTIGTTRGTNDILVGQAISATELLIDNGDGWQYIGSNTSLTTGTCNTTSCALTSQIPTATRFIVTNSSFTSGNCAAGFPCTAGSSMVVPIVGPASLSDKFACVPTGNGTALECTIGASISGSVLTIQMTSLALGSSWSNNSSAVYFYR